VDPHLRAVQVIILCPTRELAVQVAEEIFKLSIFKNGVQSVPIYGGQSYDRQIRALQQGAQIVIGTPGRILDHIDRRRTRQRDQSKSRNKANRKVTSSGTRVLEIEEAGKKPFPVVILVFRLAYSRMSGLSLRSIHTIPFERITGVLPVRYSAGVMPDVLKTMVDELLVNEHACRAAEVRAIDDDLLIRIERVQSMFQALEMDRTGNPFGTEHPVIQTINQLKVPAAIKLVL